MVKEVKAMSAFHDDLARVFPVTFQFAATTTSGTYWSTIPHKLVNPIHAEMDTAIRTGSDIGSGLDEAPTKRKPIANWVQTRRNAGISLVQAWRKPIVRLLFEV